MTDHLWRSFSLRREKATLAPTSWRAAVRHNVSASRVLPTSTSRVRTTVSIWPIFGTVVTSLSQRTSVFRALALTFSCTSPASAHGASIGVSHLPGNKTSCLFPLLPLAATSASLSPICCLIIFTSQHPSLRGHAHIGPPGRFPAVSS